MCCTHNTPFGSRIRKFLEPSIILILSKTKLMRELLLSHIGPILSFSENKVGPKVAKLSKQWTPSHWSRWFLTVPFSYFHVRSTDRSYNVVSIFQTKFELQPGQVNSYTTKDWLISSVFGVTKEVHFTNIVEDLKNGTGRSFLQFNLILQIQDSISWKPLSP